MRPFTPKILLRIALALMGLAGGRAWALNILVYGAQADPWGQPAAANIAAVLASVPGNTVTLVQLGTTTTDYECPTENWFNYDQVWDFRFFNDNSKGCPPSGAPYLDEFGTCWQTKADQYLQCNGNLFLIGENAGFSSRDNLLETWLKTIGALNAGYGVCNFGSSNQNSSTGGNATYGPTTGLPGGPYNFYTEYTGGVPLADLNGTSFLTVPAAQFNEPSTARAALTGWSGAAQLPGLAPGVVGKLFVSWDISGMFDNYSGANKTTNDALYKGISQWLGAYTPCGTPTYTYTPTDTVTPSHTPSPPPTPTPYVPSCGVHNIGNIATDAYGASNQVCVLVVTHTSTPGGTNTYTPTPTFSPTSTSTRTPTWTPTATPTPTPSVTKTPSPSSTPTASPSATLTFTPSATPSFTDTPTNSPSRSPTDTPSRTPTSTPTPSPTASATLTFTPSATPSFTDTPTNSPSRSPTDTPSMTLTPTSTPSPTASATLTFTPSATPSFTDTPTNSPSRSPTDTPSMTLTPTSTPSPTASATLTFTPSATPSFTDTPTFSPSRSPTDTPSSTPSLTATPTLTLSPSATPSSSVTLTPSPTLTRSPTPTASPTPSNSPLYTATDTPTSTATPTWTLTPSPTNSFSDTPTPSDSPTLSMTVSDTPSLTSSATPTPTLTQTVTSSGTPSFSDTPSATASVTATLSATPSLTPTASASPTPTFTLSSTPSRTHSPTQSASPTPTFSATPSATASLTPSPTRTASPTLTASPTPTASATRTATFSDTPSRTFSPTFTDSPTVTPTPVPMPLQITVTIYNSAGEEVKHLFAGSAQDSPAGFTTDTDAFVSKSGKVTLSFNGQLQGGINTLVWSGDNDNAQSIGGGVYYIKVESTDQFGAKSSYVKSVTVLPPPPPQSLNIYNSAGEIVAHLDTATISASTMTGLGFRDSAKTAYVLGSGGGVPFVFQDAQGHAVDYTWNGKNGQGNTVGSGSYTAQLVNDGVNGEVVVSKGFVLLADPAAGHFDVIEGPNPVGPSSKALIFALSGLGSSQDASVKLYNLAGELVAQGVASAGSGTIVLRVGNWAAGIYVAVVEAHDGGTLISRKLRRIAVSR